MSLAAVSSPFVLPSLSVVLCVLAAVGTMLALPSHRKSTSIRLAGAGMMALALLAVIVLLVLWSARSLGSVTYAYFWIFASIALFGSARVITHRLPVYSALYFVLTVFASAGLFILVWAEFMAAALVIIYAGAILVTYTFVIMLAAEASGKGLISGLLAEDKSASPGDTDPGTDFNGQSREPILACLAGFGVLGTILFVVFEKAQPVVKRGFVGESPAATRTGNLQDIAVYLFSYHLVSMLVAGLILTLAMVGAIMIAKKRVLLSDEDAEAVRRLTDVDEKAEKLGAEFVDDNPHSIAVAGEAGPRSRLGSEREMASLD